ncbi:MAG: OmpA family protein [Bacteroidetes bacterium]|nr:OmpA family protein [Bacteroidota bacterium]
MLRPLKYLVYLFIVPHALFSQQGSSSKKLLVQVCIDGNSKLHIKGGKMSWEHLQDTPPGMHDMCAGPIKVNGKVWKNWKSAYTLDFSTDSCSVMPTAILKNEVSRLVQAPSAANGWETIWHFNDPSAYPHEYSLQILFLQPAKSRPKAVKTKTPAVAKDTSKPETRTAKKENKDNIITNYIPNTISFGTGNAVLTEQSMQELNKIAASLKTNENIIEINGHTNHLGEKNTLLQLSEERAKAVYEYLLKKGINANRMTYKGYGDTKPLVSKETNQSETVNRRVEIKILTR